MRNMICFLGAGVMLGCAPANWAVAESPPGVAVVELFTSQGCSSCPPADRLLAMIARLNSDKGLPVYCLSFHVDYWNSLGWKDPFSDPQSTARQHRYAKIFQSDRVYTPQMVINGTVEFVGSDATKARNTVKNALKQPSTCQIDLWAEAISDRSQIETDYVVAGNQPGELLHVAMVQIASQNEVSRGENVGKRLAHVNVVRAFQTVSLDKQRGSLTFDLPRNMNLALTRIVAFAQERETGHVTGACAAMPAP